MRKLRKIITAITTAVSIITVPVFSAFAANGVVDTALLNVRSGPGTNYEVVGQVSSGTTVEVLESGNGWYKIGYGAGESYVDGRYVKLNETVAGISAYYNEYKYGKVTASSLNIRSAASTDSDIIGRAAFGAVVEIVGKQNGFVIVKHNGQEGFMSELYIEYITFEQYVALSSAANSIGARAVDVAMQYIGVPYVYGGTTPRGFDCSGFSSYVYRQLGYSLNRTAASQASNGVVVASKADLQPGDLVLFNTTGYGIGHVGIYIGNGNMVHAPKPGTYVRVEDISTGYYAARYVGARRIA